MAITFDKEHFVIDSTMYGKHYELLRLKNRKESMIRASQRITFYNPDVERSFQKKLIEIKDKIKALTHNQ